MRDYTDDAEALFRDFARRHSFAIERVNEPNVELLMRLPKQQGLSFELMLGLQNADELNIGFEEFWSYFFPFEEKRRIVESALDCIAFGECRLAIYRQFSGIFKRELEQRSNGSWHTIYAAWSGWKLPFVRTQVSYIYNDDARSR
jgi:hypothetical protein